jgi:hypothetical protein
MTGRIYVHSVVYRSDRNETGNRIRVDLFEVPMIVAAGWLAILGFVLAVLLVASDADDAEELGLPAGLDFREWFGA